MLGVWNRFESLVTALLAASALVIFLYGMLARVAFPQLAPDWVLELTIFLLMWAMLLSGSALAAEGRHVRVDLIVSRFPPTVQLVLEAAGTLISAAFCVVLVISGIQVVEFAILLDERTLNSLRIPMYYYYSAAPIAFTLIALRVQKRFVELVKTRESTFHKDHRMEAMS